MVTHERIESREATEFAGLDASTVVAGDVLQPDGIHSVADDDGHNADPCADRRVCRLPVFCGARRRTRCVRDRDLAIKDERSMAHRRTGTDDRRDGCAMWILARCNLVRHRCGNILVGARVPDEENSSFPRLCAVASLRFIPRLSGWKRKVAKAQRRSKTGSADLTIPAFDGFLRIARIAKNHAAIG